MTPSAFIAKWSKSELRERQGAQEHFIDLCRLIGEPTPAEADPSGATYCFERGATKVGGGDGWADVWRRGCFGIEYKGKHKDLNAALRQLQIYAPDLENPPYLIVCDMERIIVHTNWTNTIRRTLEYTFDDLRKAVKLDELRQIFRGSESLKPGISPQALTALVATRFGDLGKQLQERGHEPRAVAHFLNRLIFCLFAEDAELLPKDLFGRLLRNVSYEQYNIPRKSKAQLDALFAIMAQKDGGFFGADTIRWFNGGLFDEAQALPLERDDVDMLVKTAKEHDWSNIDPAVFGTMFEEALKTTGRRAALGAHYTDREKILKIIDPVIVRPLVAERDRMLEALTAESDAMKAADAERQAVHEEAARDLTKGRNGEATRRKTLAAIAKRRDAAYGRAVAIRDAFLARLAAFRVLDPACGSGNFLYVALQAIRDIELRALLDADRLGVPQVRPRVNLDAVRGIEIEPYAAELARVTLWIGNLQWERRNGYTDPPEPVLAALETIECRDALLNPDGSEAVWPAADVIVGNPPFLGGKKHGTTLDLNDLAAIRKVFQNRVPDAVNLVMYWFHKALSLLSSQNVSMVGLVGTQAIRRGSSNSVIRSFLDQIWISDAFANEPWVNHGAAVRISLVAFSHTKPSKFYLDGGTVAGVNADLTADTADTVPPTLVENRKVAFQGTISGGPFEVSGTVARQMLLKPANPNGQYNRDVIRPWRNADDIAGRPADYWIIDYGDSMSENEAALYEAPFKTLKEAWCKANQVRADEGEPALRQNEPRSLAFWWRLQRRRSSSLRRIASMRRVLATPRVAKFRYFVWIDPRIVPDTRLVLFAKDDDLTLGLLSSRIHERWALRFGGSHGVGNDPEYIHTITFNAFPFPEGLTPNVALPGDADKTVTEAIAAAAAELDRLREAWLNPPDLVRIEPEVVPGFPDRILPKDAAAAQVLKKRTLTNLYNERPAWLANAHAKLDAAVAAAYGWPADLTDDEILEKLFALNQERAAAGR